MDRGKAGWDEAMDTDTDTDTDRDKRATVRSLYGTRPTNLATDRSTNPSMANHVTPIPTLSPATMDILAHSLIFPQRTTNSSGLVPGIRNDAAHHHPPRRTPHRNGEEDGRRKTEDRGGRREDKTLVFQYL